MTSSPGNKTDRIGPFLTWVPILFISFIYIAGYFVGTGGSVNFSALGHDFIRFILPLTILYAMHHYLLMNLVYLKGHVRVYFLSAAVLLAVYAGALWLSSDILYQHPAPKEDTRPPRPEGDHKEPEPPPAGPHHGHPGPPGHKPDKGHGPKGKFDKKHKKGPSPLSIDIILAILLMGADFTASVSRRLTEERRRRVLIEREHLKNELDYLKAQLNPHFLMNTLNNIHAMVEINPEEAQKMLIELSRLLRYVLYEGSRTLTSLSQEIDFIESYLALMTKRHSPRRLSVSFKVDVDDANASQLPPLLFIVIIENAFKHGISPLGPTILDISLSTLPGNLLSFVCTNTRWPQAASDKTDGGLGLKNLCKRLDLIFGDRYTLDISSDQTSFTVSLTIPLQNA